MPTCIARPLLGTRGFLPSSPDRAEDPKTPQVDGGDGAGGSPEVEEDVEDRPVAYESSLDEADDESMRAGNDIACYIAGAG